MALIAAQSPGEMKRREVSWTSHEEVRLPFAGPGRDQEEGGELDSHEEVKLPFAGPGEIKRREVCWTLTKRLDFLLRVQARSRGGR